ncbi:MAG: hypothetical protein ACR2PH_05020 [Desulfobulbia bacterium]
MPVQSGWANSSGVELFTIGWIPGSGEADVPCLPIFGQSWLADCPEQHYTLGWICCDTAPVEPPGGGGGTIGGHHKRRKKPKLLRKKIKHKSRTKLLDIEVEPIPLEEIAEHIQREIERFELAIDLLSEKVMAAREIEPKEQPLILDILDAEEFIEELEDQILILIDIKQRRQDEEAILAVLMLDINDINITIH